MYINFKRTQFIKKNNSEKTNNYHVKIMWRALEEELKRSLSEIS